LYSKSINYLLILSFTYLTSYRKALSTIESVINILRVDKVANTSFEQSLTISPIPIFLNNLSTFASQLTLTKTVMGAFQQRALWISTSSPVRSRSWALWKATCDSEAFFTIKVRWIIGPPKITAFRRSHKILVTIASHELPFNHFQLWTKFLHNKCKVLIVDVTVMDFRTTHAPYNFCCRT
jgi:hypothetical protein